MDNYIVSARKYRPTSFDDVVGQDAITSTLQKAIASNHLAQSLLFCGPRGVGKTSCARILAKTINQDVSTDPGEDFSFNIFELDAASNNSVDDMRSLVDQVRFFPQQGKFKVYIIDEVHMLSKSAFNSFLKTLEEPPPHAIFILATTEKHKIIPTILSRCQIFDFKRIQVSDMVTHLAKIAEKEGITADTDALHIIAEKADGALRDALSTFDRLVTFTGSDLTYKAVVENLNILDHDYYFRAADMIMNGDMAGSMVLFNEILVYGFNGHEYINGLASHFRDLMMCQDKETVPLLEVSESVQQRLSEQSERTSPLNLLKCLRVMNDCDVQYRASKNQRLTVELTVMRMCAIYSAPSGEAASQATKKKTTVASGREDEPQPPDDTAENEHPSVPEAGSTATSEPDISYEATGQNTGPAKQTAAEPTAPPDAVKQPDNAPATAIPLKGKRRSSRHGAIRINEVPVKAKPEDVRKNMPEDAFTEENLQEKWAHRVNVLFEHDPEVLSSLTLHKPTVKNFTTIELKLDATHQLNVLAENQTVLMDALRKDLNNYSINLETPVLESVTDKKAYTPVEIFKKMLEENPELDKLRTKLGLEIEY